MLEQNPLWFYIYYANTVCVWGGNPRSNGVLKAAFDDTLYVLA